MSKEKNHNHDEKNESKVIILRIEKGNSIVENIIKFCTDNKIYGAWVSGLGAVSTVTLGLYDLGLKKYHKKTLQGPFEIVNLVGNVGKMDEKIMTHIHLVLSDKKMNAFGGHLYEAKVAATCEIKLEILDVEIIRKYNEETGLNLIDI